MRYSISAILSHSRGRHNHHYQRRAGQDWTDMLPGRPLTGPAKVGNAVLMAAIISLRCACGFPLSMNNFCSFWFRGSLNDIGIILESYAFKL